MKRYRVVTGPVGFGPGQVLYLSPEQVALRVHNLEVGKTDKTTGAVAVTVVHRCEFKRGEVIGLEGISRALEGVLEDADKAPPAPPAPDLAAIVKDSVSTAVVAARHELFNAWARALPVVARAVADEIGVDSNLLAAALMSHTVELFPEVGEAARAQAAADPQEGGAQGGEEGGKGKGGKGKPK
jgi:hypothetical protein